MNYIPGLISGILLIFSACDNDDTNDLLDKQRQLARLQTEIDALVENKTCGGAGDCATIAFGSKPCGGPWTYLVYAPTQLDVDELQAKVADYNILQSEINQMTNAQSDCAIVPDPDVGCQDGVCTSIE